MGAVGVVAPGEGLRGEESYEGEEEGGGLRDRTLHSGGAVVGCFYEVGDGGLGGMGIMR